MTFTENDKLKALAIVHVFETSRPFGNYAACVVKNGTIAAKDSVIESQETLIAALKAKKSSPWRRLGDVLIGAAAAMILR